MQNFNNILMMFIIIIIIIIMIWCLDKNTGRSAAENPLISMSEMSNTDVSNNSINEVGVYT